MELGTISTLSLNTPRGSDSISITYSVPVIVCILPSFNLYRVFPGLNLNIFHFAHVTITVCWDLKYSDYSLFLKQFSKLWDQGIIQAGRGLRKSLVQLLPKAKSARSYSGPTVCACDHLFLLLELCIQFPRVYVWFRLLPQLAYHASCQVLTPGSWSLLCLGAN